MNRTHRKYITTKFNYSTNGAIKSIHAYTNHHKKYGDEKILDFDESISPAENHLSAAKSLQQELNWNGTLVKIKIIDETSYVFEDVN